MVKVQWRVLLVVAAVLMGSSAAFAQPRPYIGYVYPAGGQQGATFQIRLGGQGMDGLTGAVITGSGVKTKVVEYFGRLNNQEASLMREQLSLYRKEAHALALKAAKEAKSKSGKSKPKTLTPAEEVKLLDADDRKVLSNIQRRMAEYENQPACASLSSLAFVEVTIAADAEPGMREIRLVTERGISNPMVFHVGQLPEHTREAMHTSQKQILGKEENALRKRPDDEVEARVSVPCTLNGQIASGEINRYRFEARKGQKLVVSVSARQLVPYVADAVPGWFQPVIAIFDAHGREVAYNDDFRFKPDPVLLFEPPANGEYVLQITDAIFRGREDWVYRMTVGEVPFVTGVFPLGAQAGKPVKVEVQGYHTDKAQLLLPPADAKPGMHSIAVRKGRHVSNRVPFVLDTLPECLDQEPNNHVKQAQKVSLGTIVNGRIDCADDWDVFQVAGKAGQVLVAEVDARKLESPLDSVLKLTDASGNLLALSDDVEDPTAGTNTHHADSYIRFKLPADGTYYVHLGDTARAGGAAFTYRLRLSQPRADFELFLVPSSLAMRGKQSTTVGLQVIRKDGFEGEIALSLKGDPKDFKLYPTKISSKQNSLRVTVKTSLASTDTPVAMCIEGRTKTPAGEIMREAKACEDRMQAFLWRHLVPADELRVLVYDSSDKKTLTRPLPPDSDKPPPPKLDPKARKFSKRQVAGRLKQLAWLYEEFLLSKELYLRKVVECEAAMSE